MDHRHLKKIEDELWEAADQLRANSKLTASEYAMPVLGLIFLRHAFNRFLTILPEVEASLNPRLTGAAREDQLPESAFGQDEILRRSQRVFEHFYKRQLDAGFVHC